MKILFVCTGNTCRSCMAEAIAKLYNKENNLDHIVSSAGIYAFAGDSASENSNFIMNEMGIDVSYHMARPLNEDMLKDSNLVLTMTNSHKNSIAMAFPSEAHKVFTLMEYIGEDGDIVDPFGGNIEDYRYCANQLKNAIYRLFKILQES